MDATDLGILLCNVELNGAWLPCEYKLFHGKPFILSLGDVERTELVGTPVARRRQSVGNSAGNRSAELSSRAADFYGQIAPERKIVVLVPEANKEIDVWRCRQILKSALEEQVKNKGSLTGQVDNV